MVNNIISKEISEKFSGYYFFIVMLFWNECRYLTRDSGFFIKKTARSVFLKRFPRNFVA